MPKTKSSEKQFDSSKADMSIEIERLQKENALLRSRLSGKADYIRNKTNALLEVMGTKPLPPEELDDEVLVELDPLGIISGTIGHILDNLKETNQQLQVVNQETSAIFSSADVGILVVDGQKRIKDCNNKMRQLFFPDQEIYSIIGSYCNETICRNHIPAQGCVCELLRSGMKVSRIDNWKFDGRIFNVVATPIGDFNGETSDIVIVYNDITELKLAEEKLGQLNAELESRIRERTTQLESINTELECFCYTVSHDLRAPLRHIYGFTNILAEECAATLNDLGRDCLKRICRATDRMGMLIDDLLNLSKVSQADIAIMNVNLSKSAQKVIQMFRDTDPERVVRTHVEEGLSAIGDSMLLDLVLQNLIGNSWKYSANNPEAEIEVGQITIDGRKAFFVRDNGTGFDMAYSKKLFRVFERLHGSDFEGTGVGLATVQRIINRHGGDVWAESAIGKGATFYFVLPDSL